MYAIFRLKIYINNSINTKFRNFKIYEIIHTLLAACLMLIFFLFGLVFSLKDGDNIFLRNIGLISPD
jgi:hypothetical protein